MTEEFVVVLTTLPLDMDASAFARALVDERLAACVNIHSPMTSVYRWQGRLEEDGERQLTIKTTRARLEALQDRIRALHPYDVPEFVVIPIVDGSSDYLGWVVESTT
jgi:periplasmic divalent cation tolerance protein